MYVWPVAVIKKRDTAVQIRPTPQAPCPMKSNRYLAFAAIFVLLTVWMLKAFVPGIAWGAVFALSLIHI